MNISELAIWWTSLSIAQKERIAAKAYSKAHPAEETDYSCVKYPACSVWWNSLDQEQQQTIHDHCVDRHGYLLQDWNDAKPYGD